MPTHGKSEPPPAAPRDARTDSSPAPVIEETRLPSSRSMKAARDIRDIERSRSEDVARLKAEHEADVDDLAAMLVRVADSDKARDAAEKRASALEAWTVELEKKVAAARTRADEAEATLETLKAETADLRTKVATLETDLSAARREHEDAMELERVKRGLEIDALVSQHQAAMAETRKPSADPIPTARLVALMEELERTESTAALSRKAIFDEARRLVSSDYATAPPPPIVHVSQSSPTMPPTARNTKKRARRPSAPPLPPKPPEISPAQPDSELETFADLDLGD